MIDKLRNTIICGDCLEVMKDWPDECIDFLFADPPYNSGIDYGSTCDDSKPTDEYWHWLDGCIAVFVRVANVVIIKHSAQKIVEWAQYISPEGKLLIWHKPFSSGFPHQGFAMHYEALWLMCGKARVWAQDVFVCNSGAVNPEANFPHPAQTPEKLVRELIRVCAPPEPANICDPFAGSGTTLVAARDMGHNYIGIEISPDYCKLAEKRLAQRVLF